MARPHGSLTGPQIEILDIIWERGKAGATVGEIWHALSARRPVARTTVLTVVNRLENRGWLVRRETERGLCYHATCVRDKATGWIAAQFVDEMFGGSAAELVRSLLGSHKIDEDEIQRLRDLLNKAKEEGQP